MPPPGHRGWRRASRRWPRRSSRRIAVERSRGSCMQRPRNGGAGTDSAGLRPRRSRAATRTKLGGRAGARLSSDTSPRPHDPGIDPGYTTTAIWPSRRSRSQKPGASHRAGRRRSSEALRQAPLATPNRRARRRPSREVAGRSGGANGLRQQGGVQARSVGWLCAVSANEGLADAEDGNCELGDLAGLQVGGAIADEGQLARRGVTTLAAPGRQWRVRGKFLLVAAVTSWHGRRLKSPVNYQRREQPQSKLLLDARSSSATCNCPLAASVLTKDLHRDLQDARSPPHDWHLDASRCHLHRCL